MTEKRNQQARDTALTKHDGRQRKQRILFESGNELAAYAAKQINYHVMGYYPITPSTQIAEALDTMKSVGMHEISMIAAEGEHSAAGICYGAAAGGGRVFNATSANGLLYALEQFPVQSGTRFPMVMNIACRTVSGPLSIKGDHSDVMYMLNTGWLLLFATEPQAVYDLNLCALKLAERVKLPVAVAFDGFFTSHQKKRCRVFESDEDVQEFIGSWEAPYSALDMEHPVTIGSYMNEPDLLNNKYQLHLAMEEARKELPKIWEEYGTLTGRCYSMAEGYRTGDARVILFLLGSSYQTARDAVDRLREQGVAAGALTAHVLRPFPAEELWEHCRHAETIVVGDRQDSYGAGGGNMTLEIKAMLQSHGAGIRVLSRIYGLGGRDFYVKDAAEMLEEGFREDSPAFAYRGVYPGEELAAGAEEIFSCGDAESDGFRQYFAPITGKASMAGGISCEWNEAAGKAEVKGLSLNATAAAPKRLAPGHGACPGCGIPVNVNLLLRGITGNVVLLFQTGCGMVVTTAYPKTAFKIPYVHNLFQNGAATLSGLREVFRQRQKRGELPEGEITFVMVSGDGGMDIGMGSAIGAGLRNERLIIFEYDNGGYMNTGYQLSYSTPRGAKTATSHIGPDSWGKEFFHKDTPMIMAATGIPYVATAAESNPTDFIRKAAKAAWYANNRGMAYIKALSACPLNWNDKPNTERRVIGAGVDCCYFPLFEIENGITAISYNPEKNGKKLPVKEWLGMMGRTKHLTKERCHALTEEIQAEIDRRWERLKALDGNPQL